MQTVSTTKPLAQPTLPALGIRPLLFQAALIAAAVALPGLAHWLGAPILWLVPMHWPVLLAGLVYGWAGGGLTGLLVPLTSLILTGRPPLPLLPAMTAELAAYGFFAGLFRERFHWSGPAAAAAALLSGRVVYLAITAATGTAITGAFLQATLLPGLLAAFIQILLLPPLARRWVESERRTG